MVRISNIGGSSYTLPTASATTLGGIKVGTRLSISNGVLSADSQTTDISGKANIALDNLASVAINTSLISDTDSTDDLGSSSKYWANVYTDKIYLNSTANIDGATAGFNTLSGALTVINSSAYNENSTVAGVHIGSTTTQRIGFFNGTAAQNWQIDNSAGAFRWYLPGVVHFQLTSTGAGFKNYLRVGSTSAPSNTTAGDLTYTRGFATTETLSSYSGTGSVVSVTGTKTNTASGATSFASYTLTAAPTSNSSAEFRALTFSNSLSPASDIIATINTTPTAGGSGYTAGDVLTLAGGTGGTVTVGTVDGSGAVTSVALTTGGQDYTVGAGIATTGGTGTSCTIEVLTLDNITLNLVRGGHFETRSRSKGLVSTCYGINSSAFTVDSSSKSTAQATTAIAYGGSIYSRPSGTSTATITTGIMFDASTMANNAGLTATTIKGLNIANISANTITTLLGVDIASLTRAATNIGIRVAAPSGGATANYAIQLSDTGGTAAGGITFGTDTTLYRSAADTLKTDDNFLAPNIDVLAFQVFS